MTTTERLRECPFCGGTASIHEDIDGGKFIECSGCRASSAKMYPEMDAVDGLLAEKWNKRHAAPAMLAVIEAAEELADGVDCNDHCTARGGGACTCGMEALTGKVYAALAAFREVRE